MHVIDRTLEAAGLQIHDICGNGIEPGYETDSVVLRPGDRCRVCPGALLYGRAGGTVERFHVRELEEGEGAAPGVRHEGRLGRHHRLGVQWTVLYDTEAGLSDAPERDVVPVSDCVAIGDSVEAVG